MAGETHNATLVRGNVYVYAGKRFEKDKAVPVTDDEMAHLEENAIDRKSTQDGEPIEYPKFKFTEIDADAEDAGEDEAPAAEEKKITKRKPRSRSRGG